jgi:hypothetical protein
MRFEIPRMCELGFVPQSRLHSTYIGWVASCICLFISIKVWYTIRTVGTGTPTCSACLMMFPGVTISYCDRCYLTEETTYHKESQPP